MKNLNVLNSHRIQGKGYMGDEGCGAFKVFVGEHSFNVIASDGHGWDHVSVSPCNLKRCPTWEEMCKIKDMFFEPEEVAFQLHPAQSHYVNVHPYCLHLWRVQNSETMPLPPLYLV